MKRQPLTVLELIDLLEVLSEETGDAATVQLEGCDCYEPAVGAHIENREIIIERD